MLVLASGCTLKAGRMFASPDTTAIKVGSTDKAFLRRAFGDPYQVGLDSGDETWRWFYAERSMDGEISKDLSVRFDANGMVKSYSFLSNFPQDKARMRP